jgi:hypothetical protein
MYISGVKTVSFIYRKRRSSKEKHARGELPPTNEKTYSNGSANQKPDPDELIVVHENPTYGENESDNIRNNCPLELESDNENVLPMYSTVQHKETDTPSVPLEEQPSNTYSEVQHEKSTDMQNVAQTREKSNLYSVAQNINHADIYSEVHKEKQDVLYSVVNKVPRDPTETELHDNPMYVSN